MRELLEPHASELVAKVVEMAKARDTTALRICIDRLIPPAKPREKPVSLPLGEGSLAEKGQAVLAALGEGTIAPDVATAILQGIAAQARIIEVDEIEKRLRWRQSMGSLDRRLARLEGSTATWTLTSILDWIANPTAEVPSGPIVECLESLPLSLMPTTGNQQ